MKRTFLLFIALSLLAGCGTQPSPLPQTPASTPAELPATAVFIGDSLVYGWGSLTVPFPQRSFVNKGISGDTAAGMLARFDRDVISLHPQVVLIWGGGNGLNSSSMAGIESNLRAMREAAAQAGIKVVFVSLSPHRPPLDGANPTTKELNAWLKNYAETNGAVYVDVWPVLAGADGMLISDYAVDGVHLNLAGYAVIDPLIYNGLVAATNH